MCNTSECIAETLCIENKSNSEQDSIAKKFNMSKEGNSNKFNVGQCSENNSSYKQVCQFPISVCRRGSKDFLTWINSLITTKSSPLETAQRFYHQIQPSLFLILMCLAIVAICIEACICLVLLVNALFEPGFLFLFSTFVGVGYIGLSLLTSKRKTKSKNENKIKSKEI